MALPIGTIVIFDHEDNSWGLDYRVQLKGSYSFTHSAWHASESTKEEYLTVATGLSGFLAGGVESDGNNLSFDTECDHREDFTSTAFTLPLEVFANAFIEFVNTIEASETLKFK